VENVRKVFEEVRVDKLRRDSSFVKTVGTDPGEDQTGRSCGAEEILKEENQRPGFVGQIREIPLTVRSGKSCTRFSP
jgi:hypothetical protein